MTQAPVQVSNGGNAPDYNIVIPLLLALDQREIEVIGNALEFQVEFEQNKTVVLTKELQPLQTAQIVFKSDTNLPSFDIGQVTSRSGNINDIEYVGMWYLSPIQWVLLAILLSIAFSSGRAWSLRRRRG